MASRLKRITLLSWERLAPKASHRTIARTVQSIGMMRKSHADSLLVSELHARCSAFGARTVDAAVCMQTAGARRPALRKPHAQSRVLTSEPCE